MKYVVLLLLFIAFPAFAGGKPETLVEGGYSETEMANAIARAKSEVDVFIATLERGNASDFAIKMPVEDGDKSEHFWIVEVSYSDGVFEGIIGNEPGIVSNVSFGQTVRVRKEDITDWMFMRDGKIHGNYTMRPLLATMSREEAEFYRSMLAEP